MNKSKSVPENLSESSSEFSIPRRSMSVKESMLYMGDKNKKKEDDDLSDDDWSDDDDDYPDDTFSGEELDPNIDYDNLPPIPSRRFGVGPTDSWFFPNISSNDCYEDADSDHDFEYIGESGNKQNIPPQIPGLQGLTFLKPVGTRRDETIAAVLYDCSRALEEYRRQEGADYEYVKYCGIRLTTAPDPEDCHITHMNFLAKRKGLDSSPELFFASLGDGDDPKAVHCCKVGYGEATFGRIQHCEHRKCLQCDLWFR